MEIFLIVKSFPDLQIDVSNVNVLFHEENVGEQRDKTRTRKWLLCRPRKKKNEMI